MDIYTIEGQYSEIGERIQLEIFIDLQIIADVGKQDQDYLFDEIIYKWYGIGDRCGRRRSKKIGPFGGHSWCAAKDKRNN